LRNVSDKQQKTGNDEPGINYSNHYLERKEKAGLDDYFGDLKDAKTANLWRVLVSPIALAQAESMAKPNHL
jgi:hypothetical protein